MPPLRFQPLLKQIRWGGRRLGTVLGKPIGEADDYAESWEIADHGQDQSIVQGGLFDGWTLQQLVREKSAELLGERHQHSQFPLLIKFLDASDRLSVQVHPNDAQAKLFDPTENGKTEAWVILEAAPTSRLYVGLKPGIDASVLAAKLEEGCVEDCLHSDRVSAGDCVFIPAGTVHAIGEGILLAEVQQSSDLTFRLYDWGRLGPDGKPRELHIEQALQCIDFARGPVGPVTPRLLHTEPHRVEELVRCEHFVMQRYETSSTVSFESSPTFHVLMMLQGKSILRYSGKEEPFVFGETVLIPATTDPVQIQPAGKIVVLDAFLP